MTAKNTRGDPVVAGENNPLRYEESKLEKWGLSWTVPIFGL
jgi:hypothetical protein